MLRTAGSSSYPEKMCQRAIQGPTRSAGSISSDCPIPYQLKMRPPVPCRPNSGYSLGNTCGCEVQSQCLVCRRCSVSAVPNSPDCTTKASRPAVKHNRNTGLLSFSPKREVIALDGNKRDLGRRTSDLVAPASCRLSRGCHALGGAGGDGGATLRPSSQTSEV